MEAIFLERWLHDIIRQKVKQDPEFCQFIGRESLEEVTGADIASFQLFKLRKVLATSYEKSPFYRELFDGNGVRPGDVRSLSDLARLPFTTPEDLAENGHRFACGSSAGGARVITFTTSGVSSPQKKLFYTEADVERMTDFMGAAMKTVTAAGDVVQIILPSGKENNQGDLLARGLENIGAFPVKAGINLTAEEQLKLIEQYKPAVLFTTTRRLYRITQRLWKKHALDKLGVKTLFVCTSGYLSRSRRRLLQDAWKGDVHTHYGMTELGMGVAVECHTHDGYHFNQADLLLEVVDPATGEVIDDGREGEMVFTTLSREGTPLIRYRTRDISRLVTEPCPCGAATLLRFAEVTRRTESMITIGDRAPIYPALFDDLLYRIPQVVDYQLTVSRVDGGSSLDFVVEVTEVSHDRQHEISQALSAFPVVQRNIATGRIRGLKVDLVGLGELWRGGHIGEMGRNSLPL